MILNISQMQAYIWYLFQNNKWKFDKSVKIKEIENNLLN